MSLTFSLTALDAPSVLPRVLLVFARRRLSVHGLHMNTKQEWAHITLHLDGHCASQAPQLQQQLQRIVEVQSVDWRQDNGQALAQSA